MSFFYQKKKKNAFTQATFRKSHVDATQVCPDTQMFPLGTEARPAASRCFEGAAAVLAFAANRGREDALTHVTLILLHSEWEAKLLARFPSHVWGHLKGGAVGDLFGRDPAQMALNSKIPTTASD